jgi:putative RecB family exonuclease
MIEGIQSDLSKFGKEENNKPEEKAESQKDSKEKKPDLNIEPDFQRDIYSHSRIGTYENCPRQYKFNYIEKEEKDFENTIEAFMGSRVHDALEKLYNDLKYAKLNTQEELLEFYNKEWEEKFSEDIKVVKEDYTAENYRVIGEKFIKDYYKKYHPFNQNKLIGCEIRVFIDLDEDGEYRLQGYIDRLDYAGDGVYEIHDYKTANSLPDQGKMDEDRQLAIYSVAVKEKYADCKEVKLIWHYLAFDKEIISERTDQDLEELKQKIVNTIKEIEAKDLNSYEPKQSALCNWCAYKTKCPLFKHLYEKESLTEEETINEDGVVLANQYSKLKEKEAKLKKEIDEVSKKIFLYGKQKGVSRLFGDDSRITIWKKECVKFPGKNDLGYFELLKVLKEEDLWNSFATLDKFKLEKSFESIAINPKVMQKMAKLGRKELLERIYMSKNK